MWREIEELGIVTLYDEPHLNTPFGIVYIKVDYERCGYHAELLPSDTETRYKIVPTVNDSQNFPLMLECSISVPKAKIGFANWPRGEAPDILVIDDDDDSDVLILSDEKHGIDVKIAYNSKLYDADYKGSFGGASSAPSMEIPVGAKEYLEQAYFIISWRKDYK